MRVKKMSRRVGQTLALSLQLKESVDNGKKVALVTKEENPAVKVLMGEDYIFEPIFNAKRQVGFNIFKKTL